MVRVTTYPIVPREGAFADILLITVNKIETKAVMRAFRQFTGLEARAQSIEQRVYRDLGVINGKRVYHALSEMGSGGIGAAQQTVDGPGRRNGGHWGTGYLGRHAV